MYVNLSPCPVPQAVLADPGLKDGFSLAAKIIRTFHLPTEDVLCHMAKALVLAERYTDMKDLLVLVQSSEICPESSNDKIIISAVKVLSQHTKDVSHPAKAFVCTCSVTHCHSLHVHDLIHSASRHCHLYSMSGVNASM